MSSFRCLPASFLLIASLHAAPLASGVRTASGVVSGVSGAAGIIAFKGIPFAAPPVGDLRWRAPQPPASWTGTRAADHFGNDCTQAKSGAFGPWSAEYISASGMQGGSSEDCLYLNVWTPAKTAREKRPVFVWIHGGGFTSGSGGVPVYDGAGLAAKGIVVVTVNYRLGVFGFLAHPDLTRESAHASSGNYALLDMIAALQWIHANIAAFGGDSANVTIAGQSAGAFAVNYLLVSPLAKGLFHRAIAESGGAFMGTPSLKEAEAAGAKLAPTIAELRARSAGDLLKAGRFSIDIDGYAIPGDPYRIFSEGRQNDVPVIAGWNAADGVMFGPPPKPEAFREQAKRQYGDLSGEFLKAFPAATDAEAAASRLAAGRDQMFAWQSRTLARLQNKSGKAKVFLYYFDRVAPGTPEQTAYGAFHSGEIAYALNTLDLWHRPWEDADRKLAAETSSYWANFAKTGDPNSAGLPEWPAFTAAGERSMKLGVPCEAIATPHKSELDFFDAWYARQRQPK